MKDNRKIVQEQAKFCGELMKRLENSVKENINVNAEWRTIANHSQISNDIIRLRRELNT